MNLRYNPLLARTCNVASKFSTRFIAMFAAMITLLVVLGAQAYAAPLVVEQFNYAPASALVGQGGWANHSAGINPQTVTAPSLSYPGYVSSGIGNAVQLATTGEDDNLPFASQTAGSVYASVLVNVTSSQITGDYVMHFALSPVLSTFTSRLFIKKDPTLATFAFGVQMGSTAVNTAYTPFSFVNGTTYLVVLKHTFVAGAANDIVNLFVNPVISVVEPAATLTTTTPTTADVANIGGICFRQGSSSNAPVVRFDGLRIATNWTDALGAVVMHNITASAGAGGSIAPNGVTAVPDLGSQTYTITPNSCFTIADVLVDGVSVGAVSTYTFSNVIVDHTIAASFTATGPYTITASAGAGGGISPNGATSVACGGSQAFTIAPNSCFVVSDVLVDGVSVGAVTSYSFTNVQAGHTIAASFAAAASYTVTASSDANGSISTSTSPTW